jgi:hypothetical protein
LPCLFGLFARRLGLLILLLLRAYGVAELLVLLPSIVIRRRIFCLLSSKAACEIRRRDLIKAAKIAAIEDGRNVLGIVQELLEGWLAVRKTRR